MKAANRLEARGRENRVPPLGSSRTFFLLAAVAISTPGPLLGQVPEFPHGAFPEGVTCMDCHTTEGWSPIRPDPAFNHGVVTGFPLLGRHGEAYCTACHQDLHFETLEPEAGICTTCHLDVHGGTLSADCAGCHTPTSFQDVSGIRIHQGTAFPLEGAHLQTSCESCHGDDEGGAFRPLPTECLDCHRQDYEATRFVDHQALGFPTDCLACHTPTAWSAIDEFDHTVFSGGFALAGAHAQTACASCHLPGGGLRFDPSGPEDCFACHQADYQEEHGGEGFPTTCTLCHDQMDWDREDFDHLQVAGFEFLGDHDQLVCSSCHTPDGSGTLFTPSAPDDCVACHQADYQREHTGSGYPTTCLSCHSLTTWEGASGDHQVLSGGFTLIGNHDLLACSSCHALPGLEPIFTPTSPEDCLACHLGDFQREHSGSGYPATCLTCHAVTTWDGASFDHDGDFFPIYSGTHNGRWDTCQTCHPSPDDFGVFTCLNCHEHNKASTDNDHDEVGGYVYESGQCLSCHPTGRS